MIKKGSTVKIERSVWIENVFSFFCREEHRKDPSDAIKLGIQEWRGPHGRNRGRSEIALCVFFLHSFDL